MKKFFSTFLLSFAIFGIAFSQTARVQVIHNSPTPTVDVWANSDLLLDNFAFRTATPFVDVPAEVQINLGVALPDSDSADDAIANFPVTLADGGTYVVVNWLSAWISVFKRKASSKVFLT